MVNDFGVTFVGLDEMAMVYNGSRPLAKNPRSGFGQSDFFIIHPERLKKGWSLPGKSFNFGRLASTSGLSSSSASAPTWYLSFYLFGLFCLVIFSATQHMVCKMIYIFVFFYQCDRGSV